MARFIVTLQPARGHLTPLLPYLRELHDRHDVLVATSAGFAPAVERAGLPVAACGVDWLEAEAEESFPGLQGVPPSELDLVWMQETFLGEPLPAMARDVRDLAEEWGADVVLHETWEYGGPLAAELLDLPHALLAVGGRLPPPVLGLLGGDALREHRRDLGLPDDDEPEQAPYRWACLSPVAPSWMMPGDVALPNEHFFAPTSVLADGAGEPPAWLDEFSDGQPIVYVTLGTVFNRTPGVMEVILEGLADGPWKVVATVGRTRDPAEFGTPPDKVRIESFVPHRELLPTCDAVVSHAGFSTTLDAVYAEVPHLAVPLFGDQSLHAAVVDRLGLGRLVDGEAMGANFAGLPQVVPDALTPETVRRSLEALLDSGGDHRPAIQALRNEIGALPGPGRFVALAERLATERRPLLRNG